MDRTVTTNKLTSYLAHLLLLLALFTSAAAHSAERITYYHNDNLGSPVAATDTQGNVVWRESYQPDGTRLQHQGDNQNKLWFTGKQEEATFGVSYFGARWYDPEMGRFLAMDPVGVSPSNPISFNRYAYANNNPYRFVDPDGKSPFGGPEDEEELTHPGETLPWMPRYTPWVGGSEDFVEPMPDSMDRAILQELRAEANEAEQAAANSPRTAGGGSPALKGDPYHPDSVVTRQEDWQNAYGRFDAKTVAEDIGYNTRIPPQKAPFNSHGQPVFSNGKNYISPDVDGHNVTNGWKMFDMKGRRTGTWNSDLSKRLRR